MSQLLASDLLVAVARLRASERRYAPEQVYASYGARSSGALLLSYGFVPGGVNPHEAVDLELGLPGGDPLHAEKARTLAACGLGHSQRFPLRLGAFPDGMMQVLLLAGVLRDHIARLRKEVSALLCAALLSCLISTQAAVPLLGL